MLRCYAYGHACACHIEDLPFDRGFLAHKRPVDSRLLWLMDTTVVLVIDKGSDGYTILDEFYA